MNLLELYIEADGELRAGTASAQRVETLRELMPKYPGGPLGEAMQYCTPEPLNLTGMEGLVALQRYHTELYNVMRSTVCPGP